MHVSNLQEITILGTEALTFSSSYFWNSFMNWKNNSKIIIEIPYLF